MSSGVLRLKLIGVFFNIKHPNESGFVLKINNPHSHDAKLPALTL